MMYRYLNGQKVTWRFLLSLHGCSSGFLTGFRRVPILGMDQIQMKIRVKQIQSGSNDQHYPESLTCHSILDLPLYSTREIIRDRLTEALIPEGGFLWWWTNSCWARATTLSGQGKGALDFYFRITFPAVPQDKNFLTLKRVTSHTSLTALQCNSITEGTLKICDFFVLKIQCAVI